MSSVRSFAGLWFLCLALGAPVACSTTYFDLPGSPSQPDASDDSASTFAADAAWFFDDLAGPGSRAGFSLVLATSDPAPTLSLYLDDALLSASPLDNRTVQTWGVSSGLLPDGSSGTLPSGFPDGPHTLKLVKDDGQPVLETRLSFIADAWNMLYVFGSAESPSFGFVSDPLPADGSMSRIRIVSLLDSQELLAFWPCDASSVCQEQIGNLAYGSSWAGELSTAISTVQFSWPSNLASGAPGTCQVQSDRRNAVRYCVALNSLQHLDGPGPL